MFQRHHHEGVFCIVTPSDPALIGNLIEQVKILLARSGVSALGLASVLRELLHNAIVHGNDNDPSRFVDCTVEYASGDFVKVSVEDQGPGFDYQRLAGPDAQSRNDGSHLGYAVVKAFAERVEFTDKGNGVTAHLWALPVGDTHPVNAPNPEAAPRPPRRGWHALLMAQNAGAAQSLLPLLNHVDDLHVTGTKPLGPEGVEEAIRLYPDLLITDTSSSGLAGLEAIRALRIALPESVIIAVSSWLSRSCRNSALEAGANSFLLKREAPKRLEALVRELLENTKARATPLPPKRTAGKYL